MLDEEATVEGFDLTEEQIRLLETANPCIRGQHVERDYHDQVLYQERFYVRRLKGLGRFYLQAVIGTYGSYTFGITKRQETEVNTLHDRMLPFYREHDLLVEAILTNSGTEYWGRPMIYYMRTFWSLTVLSTVLLR